MVKLTTEASATTMCIIMVSLPDTPPSVDTFSVSGVLQMAMSVPSSSKRPISRMVKPPTLSSMVIFTSIMLALVVLTAALATSPSHFLPRRAVWATVGS